MNHFTRTTAAALLWTLVTGPAQAALVKVDGTTNEVKIGGSGVGAVVLESGLGDTMEPWEPLLPVIDHFARSVAYNRLGYGRSGPAMKDPTPEHVAQHLHALLTASGVAGPWTLVGHSLGGAYMLAFARLYPKEVGAVVLVDPTPPGQSDITKERWPSDYGAIRSVLGMIGGNAKAEFKAFDGSKQAMDTLPPFPAVPIYLLQSTRRDPSINPELARWIADQRKAIAGLSPCPVVRDVADSGHYIQRDQPKAVAAAIYEAVGRPRC